MGTFCKLLLLVICEAASFPSIFARSQTKIIESFHVKSDIRFRFATTQIESVVRNIDEAAQEIVFDVTLPKEAFIVRFSMEIDGKSYDGEVKEKLQAKKVYQAAVDKGESAGHVRQVPRHSNFFEVSANVANGSIAKFTLTYQEMLHKKFGVYEHEIHINPGQAVDDFLIEIFIQENRPLSFVKTPTLRTGSLITNGIEAGKRFTIIDRPSYETAHIIYKPALSDQGKSGISARFVVEYGIEINQSDDVLAVDGYFVHFFSPENLSPMPKDIVFVLDISGSMSGQKIKQLKEAMLAILDDLQPDDRFNILTFSYWVKYWKQQIVKANETMVDAAKHFIKSIHTAGITDINSALLAGISELKATEEKRVGIIFFLTDGLPTAGTTNSEKIIANVLEKNNDHSIIFGLAFGKEADYNLLKTISAKNSGFARKIYEDSDAALQVSSLYNEISAVAIKGFSVNYLPSSVDENTITEHTFPVIFNNSEVIICGKMADNSQVFQMEMTGTHKSASFNTILKFDVKNLVLQEGLNTFFTIPRDFSGIIEKMWAYLTIKQYLREIEVHVSNEKKIAELKSKILQMSLKYKFVTPMTSMVVTKPESPDKPIESGLVDTDDVIKRTRTQHIYKPSQHIYKPSQDIGLYKPSQHTKGTDFNFPHMYSYAIFPPYHLERQSLSNYNSLNMPSFIEEIKKMQNKMMSSTAPRLTTTLPTLLTTNNTDFMVTVITAKTFNLSFCLPPKAIVDGTYTLFKFPNGTELSISTTCAIKKCTKFLIKKIIIQADGNINTITLNQNGDWIYNGILFFNGTMSRDELKVSVEDVEMKIIWLQNNELPRQYFIDFYVNSAKGYKGLIGNILNTSQKQLNKWLKLKVPAVCKDKATISRYLNNKQAAKFRTGPASIQRNF